MTASDSPFGGLFGDLIKVIGGAGGSSTAWYDAAKSLAHGVATEGTSDKNPDPLVRIRLEEYVRVALFQLDQIEGLPIDDQVRRAQILPVSRGTWALSTLEAWKPLLGNYVAKPQSSKAPLTKGADPLAGQSPGSLDLSSLQAAFGSMGTNTGDNPIGGGGLEDLFGQLAQTIGPILFGLQIGSVVGHLAQRTLGFYGLLFPRPSAMEIRLVPENAKAFADDWSLPIEEMELWICIHELALHSIMSLPHVQKRIIALLSQVAADAAASQVDVAARLNMDTNDPASIEQFLSDPGSLLADLASPDQKKNSAELIAISSAIEGYVDHVTAQAASAALGSPGRLIEAWYRYRSADDALERGAGALFGFDLTRNQVDIGANFVKGVVERAGEEGLARLWENSDMLPTPAEIEAPGLWLARIDLATNSPNKDSEKED